MSKYSYGLERISIHHPGNKQVHIGKFCSIGENCNIILMADHRTDWITTYPFGSMHCDVFNTFDGKDNIKSNGDVTIRNDVWIGSNVTIMSGVTIGDGAVIAYNSHVVKDVIPYSITGGNPAKFIKYRFKEEQVKKLLEIKWWDWEEEKINQYLPLLCSNNIDQFIQECENEE